MPIKNAFYAQSGGVTAVINASAAGLIETARQHPDQVGTVYAGRNGILGALHEELIDTSKESARAIAALKQTPSGAFGSCRWSTDPSAPSAEAAGPAMPSWSRPPRSSVTNNGCGASTSRSPTTG